jgi:hypothetical protein
MLEYARHVLHAASRIQDSARQLKLSPVSLLTPVEVKRDSAATFDTLVTETALRQATRQLFLDGHYALAVEEGYKCLNNVVKSRSGLSIDGASLMRTAFSPKSPLTSSSDTWKFLLAA